MKLIKFSINGISNFKDNRLDVDFRLKKRVIKSSYSNDISEVFENTFLGNVYGFAGVNGSGKTTTLIFMQLIVTIPQFSVDFNLHLLKDDSSIEIYYLIGSKLVYMSYTLKRMADGIVRIVKEKVVIKPMRATFNINSNKFLDTVKDADVLFDSSTAEQNYIEMGTISHKYLREFHQGLGSFAIPAMSKMEYGIFKQHFNVLLQYEKNIELILKMLDKNIESFKVLGNDIFSLKFFSRDAINYNSNTINDVLSSGTVRGIDVFFYASISCKYGSILVLDEIELHLHQSLVIELIKMFKNPRINPRQATLIFTTHMSELLDVIERTDLISIVENNNGINVTNFSELSKRNDISKKNQYLAGIVSELPSYESKMAFLKAIEHV